MRVLTLAEADLVAGGLGQDSSDDYDPNFDPSYFPGDDHIQAFQQYADQYAQQTYLNTVAKAYADSNPNNPNGAMQEFAGFLVDHGYSNLVNGFHSDGVYNGQTVETSHTVVVYGNVPAAFDPMLFTNFLVGGQQTTPPQEGGTPGGSTPEEQNIFEHEAEAHTVIDFKLAALKDMVTAYGPDIKVTYMVGDTKYTTLAVDLIEGLEHANMLAQAGTLTVGVVTGNLDVKAAINFAFGVTVSSAAAAADAPAFGVAALGFAAEYAANHLVDWMDELGRENDKLQAYMQAEILRYVQTHSDIPAGTYTNPWDMLRGMMGLPPGGDPTNGDPSNSDPGHHEQTPFE